MTDPQYNEWSQAENNSFAHLLSTGENINLDDHLMWVIFCFPQMAQIISLIAQNHLRSLRVDLRHLREKKNT